MAIRFEYQPFRAGGLAGYATGLGRARERNRDRAIAQAIEQQRLAARYGMFGGPRRLGGGARGAFGAMEAEPGRVDDPAMDWVDPALDVSGEAPRRQRQIRGQRRANDRARRMGRPAPYPEAEPQYIPGRTRSQIDRAEQLEDMDRREAFQREMFESQQEAMTGRADTAARRAEATRIRQGVQEGDLVLTGEARREYDAVTEEFLRKRGGLSGPELDRATEDYRRKVDRIYSWGARPPSQRGPSIPRKELEEQQELIDLVKQGGQEWMASPDPYHWDAEQSRRQDQANIKKAIDAGLMRYTRRQRDKIARIDDAIGEAQLDPQLSPHQRQQTIRDLQVERSKIRPVEVPLDERPVSVEQRIEQNTMDHPDYGLLGIGDDDKVYAVTRGKNEQAMVTIDGKEVKASQAEFEFKRRGQELDELDKWAARVKTLGDITNEEGIPVFSKEEILDIAGEMPGVTPYSWTTRSSSVSDQPPPELSPREHSPGPVSMIREGLERNREAPREPPAAAPAASPPPAAAPAASPPPAAAPAAQPPFRLSLDEMEKLPKGAQIMPDGAVLYEGRLYRRRQP